MADRFVIRWARTAELDLAAIVEYVAHEDGAPRAARLYEDIRTAVNTLKSLPLRGRVVPELRALGLHDFREIVVKPYRIFFRVIDRRVVLLGVVDGRRDLTELLLERALREET